MNSILHTSKYVLISACMLFTILPLYAEDNAAYTPPDYTGGAYLFVSSIENFTNLDFAYSHKVFREMSLRTNLSISQYTGRGDYSQWADQAGNYFLDAEMDSDYLEINLSLLTIWPIRKVERIEMYGGIGPYFGYSRQTDENILDGQFDTHIGDWYENKSYSLGAEGMIGLRYWVFQRVAVVGEYYGRAYYISSESNHDVYKEETDYQYERSREIEASDFYCRLYKVRLGLSYYF